MARNPFNRPSCYRTFGHRPSSLSVAQFCGQAPRLAAEHGAGRIAYMGKVFHAICSEDPQAEELAKLLSAEEFEEISRWHKPTTVEIDGIKLAYKFAEKEVEIGMDEDGDYVPPGTEKEPAEAVTAGTFDVGWHTDTAYLGDLKKTRFAAPDGPRSLQLYAYGIPFAKKHGCDKLRTGIWDCTEGRWEWSDPVDLYGFEGQALTSRVLAAAMNDSELTMGSHCKSCYARLHCPEYTLPITVADSKLAPLTEGKELTEENALEALLFTLAVQDLAKAARDTLETYVDRHGPIVDPERGKAWKPIQMPGRESVDIKRLKEAMGEDADEFIRVGRPYQQFRWGKI